MGKKIFGVIAFAAIAVAAGWNYQQNKQNIKLSDLALENVEALASGESDGKGTLYGNEAGNRFCCCPGSSTCGAASCSSC